MKNSWRKGRESEMDLENGEYFMRDIR